MVANQDEYMTSAVETVYLSNKDRNMIKVAREREEYLRLAAYKDAKIQKLTEENEKMEKELQKYKEKYGDL